MKGRIAIALAGAAAAAVLGGSAQPAPGQATDHRPNVILFLTDDETVADMAAMPRTRALIGDFGTTFGRAYSSYPLCCPSRATLLTGQYSHNHGVLGNNPPLGGYYRLNQQQTLPVWLQTAGYQTAHIGKLPNGYNGGPSHTEVPPGWQQPEGLFYGFLSGLGGAYFNFNLNENGTLVHYGKRVQDYQTDVYRQKAVDVIAGQFNGSSSQRQPLYMQLAFFAPHDPARPAPRHEDLFEGAALPGGPAFDEADLSDKPAWLRQQARRLDQGTIATITERHRNRLESLQAVDEAVQVVTDALATRGELDNTYLIFTSDNGYFQGQHRIYQGKFLPHTPSSSVPLLIRGPGIPSHGLSREIVANVDIVPTILAATGARPTLPVDGRSVLPFARDTRRRTRRPLLLEAGVADGKLAGAGGPGRAAQPGDLEQDPDGLPPVQIIKPQPYQAVLTRRYLWIRYADGSHELYDQTRDPDQLHSRHASPRYQLVRKRLNRVLNRLAGCAGPGCTRPSARIPKPLSKREVAALRAKRKSQR